MRLTAFFTWVFVAYAAFDLNRGGAVLKAPDGDSFAAVTVGIGDSLNQNYVLSGGILYNSTLQSFSAYFPGAAKDTTSAVPVASGNSITVTVNVAAAGGTVTVENTTQNRTTMQTLAAPAGVEPEKLTALAANWFVQAYQVTPGQLVQTPSYGTVSFTACSATTKAGVNVPLSGAGKYEIQGTSGQMYSKTTISVARQTF